MGAKTFSHTQVNIVWLEEICFRGFPGKLKSVGRTAVVAVAVEMDQKQLPGVT